MKRSGNKVLIIALIVIAVLAIVGGVFAYLYFATDILKSGQELFAKYLTQNVEEVSQTLSLKKLGEVEEKLKQNKYEENIIISYTEAEENEPSGTTTIDIQNDPINKKTYGMISLAAKESEDVLKLEYMAEDNMYSLRFSNIVVQFLSIENSDLKQLATKFGMDEEMLENIPDTIDFEKFSLKEFNFTDEEKDAEIKKYSQILYNNIAKEKYTKNKGTVITLNGKTITTNAYILTLSSQDIDNIAIKLLEALKQDELVLAKLQILDDRIQEYTEESAKENFVKSIQNEIDKLKKEESQEESKEEKKESNDNIVITVYEEKGNAVRIKVEQGLDYLTLDTTEVEGKKQIKANYTKIDDDNTQSVAEATVTKGNDNNLNIKLNIIEGEEQQTSEINLELTEKENNIRVNVTMNDEEGKTSFIRDINLVNEINYKVTLDSSNNIVLNDASAEKIEYIFNALAPKLTTEYIEKIQSGHIAPFKPLLMPITAITLYGSISGLDQFGSNLEETEVATFNSKFTMFEGNSMPTSTVNSLLNVVLTHNEQEAIDPNGSDYVIVTGDVTLKAEDTSVTTLDGNARYKIECKTGDNGLINEIVITKVISDLLTPDDTSASRNELNNIQSTGENIINALNGLN